MIVYFCQFLSFFWQIDEETFELLLHYLAGVRGAAADRLRAMCQELIDNGGTPLDSPPFPLAIPPESESKLPDIQKISQLNRRFYNKFVFFETFM